MTALTKSLFMPLEDFPGLGPIDPPGRSLRVDSLRYAEAQKADRRQRRKIRQLERRSGRAEKSAACAAAADTVKKPGKLWSAGPVFSGIRKL